MSGLAPGDPRHGTTNGYTNCGCRCVECREAWRVYTQQLRDRRSLPEGDARHGTFNGYTNYGCRCVECRRANREARRRANREARRAVAW